MKKFIIIYLVLSAIALTSIWIWERQQNTKYPDIDKLSHSDGMIHHPTYGSYPETVPFSQGMTLMPAQSFVAIIHALPEVKND